MSAPSDDFRARTHGCYSARDGEAFEQHARCIVERSVHPIGAARRDVHAIDPNAHTATEHASILNLAAERSVVHDAATRDELHHFGGIGCVGRCPIRSDDEQIGRASILALDQNLFDRWIEFGRQAPIRTSGNHRGQAEQQHDRSSEVRRNLSL